MTDTAPRPFAVVTGGSNGIGLELARQFGENGYDLLIAAQDEAHLRAAAAELAGTGVTVTALCPTFVKTNIVSAGRISESSTHLADNLMRWIGFSPDRVARTCLDTLDRGGLYCMPQPEARIGWGIKRFTPTVYTRAAGLITRVTT